MKILIDNGHGVDTAGKRSPLFTSEWKQRYGMDRLREYDYTRRLAARLVERLKAEGLDAMRIVTEQEDIALAERCRRVNAWCSKLGRSGVLFISIHNDAAGCGGVWRSAGGWTAYTTRGTTVSDRLAECLYDAAKVHLKPYAERMERMKKASTAAYDARQKPIRTDYLDGDSDKEANFYVLAHTHCCAVLTENLFQDNQADVEYLLTDEGMEALVELHVDGIKKYLGL